MSYEHSAPVPSGKGRIILGVHFAEYPDVKRECPHLLLDIKRFNQT
jgi:hypothetical protein